MDPKTRILMSLNHQEPDRIPIFAPNMINTREPYDPVLEAFLVNFPFDGLANVGGLVSPPGALRDDPDTTDPDIQLDGYGCRYKYMGVGLPYSIHAPLADAETLADVDAFDWPDPEAPDLIPKDLKTRASRMKETETRPLSASVPHTFHQYHYLRGFEQWMVDIKLNRQVHRAIAGHIGHINRALILRVLEEVGDEIDLVMAGDDFGHSTAPYMSPVDFQALVKPIYCDLIQAIKSRYPHIRFYLHSHGQIMDLVPDLIDCGVDVLNPILPLDHMDPVQLKQDYGDALCFHGGIDIEHIVPFGTVDEVRDHVKRVIDILAPGGGYWFKLQAISPVIPPENVIVAYETARDYGRYHR